METKRQSQVDREERRSAKIATSSTGPWTPTYRNPTRIRSAHLHENLPDLHERPVNLRAVFPICRGRMDDDPHIEQGGWMLAAAREDGACQDHLRLRPTEPRVPRADTPPTEPNWLLRPGTSEEDGSETTGSRDRRRGGRAYAPRVPRGSEAEPGRRRLATIGAPARAGKQASEMSPGIETGEGVTGAR